MKLPNARHVLTVAIGLTAIGSIVHCSSAESSATGTPPMTQTRGDAGVTDTFGDAGAGPANVFPGSPDSSKGVILVHGSANLPAFRLCFGTLSPTGYLTGQSSTMTPLPNKELMPDSNVVGVEIGSAVRLNPLSGVDPGAHVFAFPEVYARPGGGADLLCNARICPTGSSGTCLPKDPPSPGQRGFYDLGPLPAGATNEDVQLLAFHGCVAGSTDGGAGASSCGADYDASVGNLKLDLIPLSAYKTLKPEEFFVQVAQLSSSVVGKMLTVRYGELAEPMSDQDLGLSADFGQIAPAGQPKDFTLDRSAIDVYAKQGFRIGVGKQTFAKSLAEIQLVTAPQAVPSDLYSSKSNFVLLLLGDPALSDMSGNALSPQTEPGLLLHLLVVPVGQPVESDAGIADAGPG